MQSTKEPLFAGGSTPVSRYGHGSEIADVVAWLASPSASYVTDAELLADGGVTA